MVAVNPIEDGSETHRKLRQLCPAATQFALVRAVRGENFPTVHVGFGQVKGVFHLYLLGESLNTKQKVFLLKLLLSHLKVLAAQVVAHGPLFLASQLPSVKLYVPENLPKQARPSEILRRFANSRQVCPESPQLAYARRGRYRAR